MATNMNYQRGLIKELRSKKKNCYEKASIYTILLDLIENNGISTVFMTLHNVVSDLRKKKKLNKVIKKSKTWTWS